MEIDSNNATQDAEEISVNVVDIENPQTQRVFDEQEENVVEPVKNVTIKQSAPVKQKLVRLPLGRVKSIMKMDSDCNLVSQDSVFLITKATELFIEYVAKESARHTHVTKRKTILKRDVDAAIESIPSLCFLEGALE